MTEVGGVRLGTARAHIRYPDRLDVALLELAPGTQTACSFTRNAFRAAPVVVAEAHFERVPARYLLINTGNANAGTGTSGIEDAEASCRAVAEMAACESDQVLPFSTGVIGERLPLDRLTAGAADAYRGLRSSAWDDASRAILTTDTRPKLASRRLDIGSEAITLTGMAKGSGMIRPDMATMLAFIATDAAIEQTLVKSALQEAIADSFNAITVDGDTSTNDACLLAATGASGVELSAGREALATFQTALNDLCVELAREMVRDAEGATKLIAIEVEQGRDRGECRQVAYTIAHSPLVKTACFASDPNWGRILAAAGRAGLDDLALDRVSIHLDDVCIVRNGEPAGDYTEERGQQAMSRSELAIRVSLGRGKANARIWTSDLSYDYVKINAEYRS